MEGLKPGHGLSPTFKARARPGLVFLGPDPSLCLRPGKSFIRKDNLVRANETLFGLSIDLDFFAAVVLLLGPEYLRFEDYFTWPRRVQVQCSFTHSQNTKL